MVKCVVNIFVHVRREVHLQQGYWRHALSRIVRHAITLLARRKQRSESRMLLQLLQPKHQGPDCRFTIDL